jgi:hypothetical protein
MHQRKPEWQDAVNKLWIDFTVFLIDDPPMHNVSLAQSAEKLLPSACKPLVRHKLSMCLSHFTYFSLRKRGPKYYLAPLFRVGGQCPLAPCDGAPGLLRLPKRKQTHFQIVLWKTFKCCVSNVATLHNDYIINCYFNIQNFMCMIILISMSNMSNKSYHLTVFAI